MASGNSGVIVQLLHPSAKWTKTYLNPLDWHSCPVVLGANTMTVVESYSLFLFYFQKTFIIYYYTIYFLFITSDLIIIEKTVG